MYERGKESAKITRLYLTLFSHTKLVAHTYFTDPILQVGTIYFSHEEHRCSAAALRLLKECRGSTAGPGGARRGAKTAGATPTTGCVTPTRWCGSGAMQRNLPETRSVTPLGGAPAERGGNPPISARGTRSWSFRRDGARLV